ncbi:TPA: hypothetical protein DIC29_01120 [Candidatus Shapirobacteria bacterium]|nr:hypothetical protein [Candidatus Shapirobacteria bacterium]
MNEDNLVSVVVYNEDYSKKIDTLSISIGADMRGDVVIKFVPNYSALEPGDVLNVEVEGVCEINADPEYDCLFEGIEVMDAGFVMEEESTVKKN